MLQWGFARSAEVFFPVVKVACAFNKPEYASSFIIDYDNPETVGEIWISKDMRIIIERHISRYEQSES